MNSSLQPVDVDEYVATTFPIENVFLMGLLTPILMHQWTTICRGKSIAVATKVKERLTLKEMIDVWNLYVAWDRDGRDPSQADHERFQTVYRGHDVWVTEDETGFCILCPDDFVTDTGHEREAFPSL